MPAVPVRVNANGAAAYYFRLVPIDYLLADGTSGKLKKGGQ